MTYISRANGQSVMAACAYYDGEQKYSEYDHQWKYTIFVRKGTKGMYVDPISLNSGEYEFLFNRDTTFKVHMIRTDSSGKIVELVLEAKKSKR